MKIPRGGTWFWWIPIALGGFIGIPLVMAEGHVLHPINLLWAVPCFVGGLIKAYDFDDRGEP
jgi:hypothetical protein